MYIATYSNVATKKCYTCTSKREECGWPSTEEEFPHWAAAATSWKDCNSAEGMRFHNHAIVLEYVRSVTCTYTILHRTQYCI